MATHSAVEIPHGKYGRYANVVLAVLGLGTIYWRAPQGDPFAIFGLLLFAAALLAFWRERRPILQLSGGVLTVNDRFYRAPRSINLVGLKEWVYRAYMDQLDLTDAQGKRYSFRSIIPDARVAEVNKALGEFGPGNISR